MTFADGQKRRIGSDALHSWPYRCLRKHAAENESPCLGAGDSAVATGHHKKCRDRCLRPFEGLHTLWMRSLQRVANDLGSGSPSKKTADGEREDDSEQGINSAWDECIRKLSANSSRLPEDGNMQALPQLADEQLGQSCILSDELCRTWWPKCLPASRSAREIECSG